MGHAAKKKEQGVDHRYSMTTPCAHCPFRNDIKAYLRADRVREIDESLVRGEFPCHKTTKFDEDGDTVTTDKEIHCAGALILLEKMQRPSQMMRISERLGMYDARKLNMKAPVFDTFDEMVEAQPDYEPPSQKYEACSVVDENCIQPAGWATSSGVAENTDMVEIPNCYECGESVCFNCSTPKKIGRKTVRICNNCGGE